MFKSLKVFLFSSSVEVPLMQNIIKPLYFVISLFGLFPYSVQFSKSKSFLKIKNKSVYVNSLCGISIILTMIAFTTLHVQYIFFSTEYIGMTEDFVPQMNYVIEIVALVIFCITAYICAFINREVYIKIINSLGTTWVEMPPGRNCETILRRLQFQSSIIVMTVLLLLLLLQICVNFSRNNSVWKIILVATTFNLPQMIQFVSIAFYYVLIMMVVAILANINDIFLELDSNRNIKTDGFIKVRPKTTLSLRQLELAYIKAFEIKTYINRAFQAPILASSIQCFHSLICEAHIIYHGLVIDGTLTTHDFVNCSIWILYQVLKVYVIALSGTRLKEEVSLLKVLYVI